MVPYYITIRIVLSLKRFKTSNMYDNKSARALFSAPTHRVVRQRWIVWKPPETGRGGFRQVSSKYTKLLVIPAL